MSQHNDRHYISGDSQNAQRADDDGVEDRIVKLAVHGEGRVIVGARGVLHSVNDDR